MKNIYFGVAIAAILSLSACSDDDEDNKEQSSNPNSTPSSSSCPISHISPACYVTANGYSLCWENEKMTEEKCNNIIKKYKDMGAIAGEFKDSCPDEGIKTSCSSETCEVNAYTYGNPIPTCEMIAKIKIDEY